MIDLSEQLSNSEVETVRRCLLAVLRGNFFEEWEFDTLIGIDFDKFKEVYDNFPKQTVDSDDFSCAIIGSMNNLIGYPHGKDMELITYVPEGREEIVRLINALSELGL